MKKIGRKVLCMLVAVVMAFLRITPVHGIDGPTDAADTAAAEVSI